MSKLIPGDLAPGFEGVTCCQKPIRLEDFRGRKVILYFSPASTTIGGALQALLLRECHPALVASGAVLLGITDDDVDSSRRFKVKYGIPFQLIVDPDHRVARQYWAFGDGEVLHGYFVIDEKGCLLRGRAGIGPAETAGGILDALQ